jgi:hypothetical protein
MTLKRQYYTDNLTGCVGYLIEQETCPNLRCAFRTKDPNASSYCSGLKLSIYFYERGLLQTLCQNEVRIITPTAPTKVEKESTPTKDTSPVFSFYEF